MTIEERMRNRPGGSNYGKYPGKKMKFAGPSGGAPGRTYPVTYDDSSKIDPKRVRAALAYAHNAPNPAGIRRGVARAIKKKDPGLAKRILSK